MRWSPVMSCAACADGVAGEEERARGCRSRTPDWSAVTETARWMPQRPPTPVSVKPKPSWIGVNSAEMTIRKE
jgi:hypothetical protein